MQRRRLHEKTRFFFSKNYNYFNLDIFNYFFFSCMPSSYDLIDAFHRVENWCATLENKARYDNSDNSLMVSTIILSSSKLFRYQSSFISNT